MHYIYYRDGAALALDLSLDAFNKRVKKAIQLGYEPSKNIGGVEMFDIDVLMKKEPRKKTNIFGYSLRMLKVFKNGHFFE
jgi:hypothetical protein